MRNNISRRGQTAMLFTLAAVPLFGMIGLTVDIGWAHFRQEAAQTAADAAATAAAVAAYTSTGGTNMLCTSPHVACYATEYTCPSTFTSTPDNNILAGCMYAKENGFVTGGRQKVTFQSGVGAAPTAAGVTMSYWVVARVSESIPQLFSAVLGYPTASVTARASTGAREANSGGCVIALNPNASGALRTTGTTNVTTGCGVFVNSNNASDALSMVGGSIINTTGSARTEVVGQWNGGGFVQVNGVTSTPLTGRPTMGDPMLDMPTPSVPTAMKSVPNMNSHDDVTIDPGYYPGGISLGSQQTLRLNPGLYYIENGVSLGGQTSMIGTTGVTLFIKSGVVNMTGGATVSLTAPSSGTYQGILFFQDRNNHSAATLVGGTTQQMNGALYFPGASLTYTGGSSTVATATSLIADTLTLVGNSNIAAAASTLYTGNSGGVSLIE